MLFFGKRKSTPLVQSSTEDWRKQWQDLVPPECRNVPVTVDGKTMTAYVQINHFVMMLQDGLLMQQGFFDVCAHFQRAGYRMPLEMAQADDQLRPLDLRQPLCDHSAAIQARAGRQPFALHGAHSPARAVGGEQRQLQDDPGAYRVRYRRRAGHARRAVQLAARRLHVVRALTPPLTYLSNRENANAQNFVASDDLAANR